MKPTRFTGPNSRDVMQQVRAALGADALILANRSIPEGVEILAEPKVDRRLEREGRMPLAQACFDFLPHRARLDIAGWPEIDIFAHM